MLRERGDLEKKNFEIGQFPRPSCYFNRKHVSNPMGRDTSKFISGSPANDHKLRSVCYYYLPIRVESTASSASCALLQTS